MPRAMREPQYSRPSQGNNSCRLPSLRYLELLPDDHLRRAPDNSPDAYYNHYYDDHPSSVNQAQGPSRPSILSHDVEYAPYIHEAEVVRSASRSLQPGRKRPRPIADDDKRNGHKQKEKKRRCVENEQYKDIERSLLMMRMPMAEEERQGQHNSSRGQSKAALSKEAKQRKWNAGKNDCALEYTKLEILSKASIAIASLAYLVQVMPDVVNIVPDEIKNPRGEGLTLKDVQTQAMERMDDSRRQSFTSQMCHVGEAPNSLANKEPLTPQSLTSSRSLSLPDGASVDRKFSASSSGGESSATSSSAATSYAYRSSEELTYG